MNDDLPKCVVELQPIPEPVCCECEDEAATVRVMIDFPRLGQMTCLGDMCQECADETVHRQGDGVLIDGAVAPS